MMPDHKKHHPPLDLARLLDDHGIEHRQGNGDWTQLCCPFCDDRDFHLGWSGTVFSCFRCGRLGRVEVVAALLDLTPSRTAQELLKYEGHINPQPTPSDASWADLGRKKRLFLPHGTTWLAERHRSYLKTRQFDPDRLEADWDLLGTGTVGPFAHRIIIPIVQGGKFVCYQGRDITGRSPSKYKSCPDDKAITPIKSCLYGSDKVRGESVVVTEGPTKVWRLGAGAVCTFGATVTAAQVTILKRFRRAFLLFDEDEAGREGADKVGRELATLNIRSTIITVGIKDAAELPQADADALMRELI